MDLESYQQKRLIAADIVESHNCEGDICPHSRPLMAELIRKGKLSFSPQISSIYTDFFFQQSTLINTNCIKATFLGCACLVN